MKKIDVKLIDGKRIYNAVVTIKENSLLITTDESYMIKLSYNDIISYKLVNSKKQIVITTETNEEIKLESDSINEIYERLNNKQIGVSSNGKSEFKDEVSSDNVIEDVSFNNNVTIPISNYLDFSTIFGVILVIASLIFTFVILPNIINSSSGNEALAEMKAVEYFQSYNTTASELKCKAKSTVDDIILVKCETTDSTIKNTYGSSTIWYGYMLSADESRYWQYGSSDKDKVIETIKLYSGKY